MKALKIPNTGHMSLMHCIINVAYISSSKYMLSGLQEIQAHSAGMLTAKMAHCSLLLLAIKHVSLALKL